MIGIKYTRWFLRNWCTLSSSFKLNKSTRFFIVESVPRFLKSRMFQMFRKRVVLIRLIAFAIIQECPSFKYSCAGGVSASEIDNHRRETEEHTMIGDHVYRTAKQIFFSHSVTSKLSTIYKQIRSRDDFGGSWLIVEPCANRCSAICIIRIDVWFVSTDRSAKPICDVGLLNWADFRPR